MAFCKSLAEELLALDIVSFAVLPGVIALLIADGLESEEQEVLGTVFTNIGDILTSLAFLAEVQDEVKGDNEELDAKIEGKPSETKKLLAKQEQMQQQLDNLQFENKEMQKYLQEMMNRLTRI